MQKQRFKMPSVIHRIAQTCAVFTLAFTFIAAGLALCCIPQTTKLLAESFSGQDNPDTAFSHEDLVWASLVTRDYTIGSNDLDALITMLQQINRNADTPYSNADDEEILTAPERYTLDEAAISHLDDVYEVISVALWVFAAIAIAAVASCSHVLYHLGKHAFGTVLLEAGIGVILLFSLIGTWALIDFNGFFAFFHSLFFADGTWTFSYQSLLITMYPLAFWMGMGSIWLAITGVLSILSLAAGIYLRRIAPPNQADRPHSGKSTHDPLESAHPATP